jgi:hypothetical protein
MQIHVARNSAQLGIFSSEEIIAGLQSGRFHASDLAWRDGMAAWTPLGDWPEFRLTGVPASPGAATVPGEAVLVLGETTFPWEISKSPSSAYASFVSLFRNPDAVLANARLEFFPTLQLVWIILLAASVFSIIGGVIHAEAVAQAMRTAGDQMVTSAHKIGGPLGEAFARLAEYYTNTKAKGPGEVVLQVLLMVAVIPLYYLLIGLLQWVGLRLLGLFGVKSCKTVELGRTVAASMLGHVLLGAVLCPVALLAPQSGVLQIGSIILFILGAVIYFRAVGGALRIDPWTAFGSAALLLVATTCCCCSCCGLFAGLGSAVTP